MISEQLKSLIGKRGTPVIFEVTRLDLRKAADAAGDRNPLYWDDDYAEKSRYKGIIAPPDFFGWPVNWPPNSTFVYMSDLSGQVFIEVAKAGYHRAINAGMESEFFHPVRPGDILIMTSEVIGVEEKEGKKGGKMCISTIENTYINQRGAVVAKQRHSAIH